MKIIGGKLAARVEAITAADFIQPPKRTDCAEIIEGAFLDFHEKQVFTVASQIMAELEMVKEQIKESKNSKFDSLIRQFHELSDQYRMLTHNMFFSIQDRLDWWGKSIGIGSNFRLVVPEDTSNDVITQLMGNPKFMEMLKSLAKDFSAKESDVSNVNLPIAGLQKGFTFSGPESSAIN